MLVSCPQCKTQFRLVDYDPDQKIVKYLCPGCGNIVPIDLEMDEVQSSSSSGHFRAIKRRKTVLVADDDAEVLEQCRRLLTGADYGVLVAGDGRETVRLIREKHPDLVVLDLSMPHMTGFDVLRAVRRDPRIQQTRVLAMSSVYKEDILQPLQQLGAEGFLDKEQLEESLVFRVRNLLEAHKTAS